jgi:hypothetical protein
MQIRESRFELAEIAELDQYYGPLKSGHFDSCLDLPIGTCYIAYSISYEVFGVMRGKSISDSFVGKLKLPNRDKGERQKVYIDTMQRGVALVLVVSYGGSKTFRVMTYRNGKAHTVKLGSYPQLTAKAAREKALAFYHNPEKFNAEAQAGSFKDVAENWFKRHVEAHRLRSQEEIRRQLEKYVYPKWKERKFFKIRRRDVNDLLDDIADRHGRNQAPHVQNITMASGI